jgi:SAM-dependent methyltransferase
MKKLLKKLILIVLSINIVRISLYKIIQFLLQNFQEDSSNTYDLSTIKRIGTKEGIYSSKKIVDFIVKKIDLNDKFFLDIGCGDLFLIEDLLKAKISNYYGFDLNQTNLDRGTDYIKKKNISSTNIITEQGNYFEFNKVQNLKVDVAFSQAVCSHLSINSLTIMLKSLLPKMKNDGILLSSFIITDKDINKPEPKVIKWNKINKFSGQPHNVTSFFLRDPYHYNLSTISQVANMCGWKLIESVDYDHDLQKMLIFKIK